MNKPPNKARRKRDYERKIDQAWRDGWNAAAENMRIVMPSHLTTRAPRRIPAPKKK